MPAENLALLHEALANHKSGNLSTALLLYRAFLGRGNENLVAWECYSSLLLALERFEACADACRQALAIDRDSEQAKTNLALALKNLLYQGISEKNPDDIQRIASQLVPLVTDGIRHKEDWQHSQYKLLLGDFEEGWRLYESRFGNHEHNELLTAAPRWDGAPYPGKILLVHWEQGFGDTIMMLRYMKRVKELGGTLLLSVPGPLADLAATCEGPDQVFGRSGEIHFHLQIPMMSLPMVCKTGLESIPSRVPYISVPANVPNKAAIDSRINAASGDRKYGLAWAGRPTHPRDAERSIQPSCLGPLGSAKNASWYCLQREVPDTVPFEGAVPLGDLLESFADTAYAVSKMDSVVTVDTSIAHVAGALGIPVKLLLAFFPDWRWMLWRSDSPWYPSIKLFRQPGAGDWASAIQQVVEDCGDTPSRFLS